MDKTYEFVTPPRKVIGMDNNNPNASREGTLLIIKKDSDFSYILDVGNDGYYPAFKAIKEIKGSD